MPLLPCFFQKHLLFESWLELDEPVEKELIYFQVLYTLRADKFPVTQMEAVSTEYTIQSAESCCTTCDCPTGCQSHI